MVKFWNSSQISTWYTCYKDYIAWPSSLKDLPVFCFEGTHPCLYAMKPCLFIPIFSFITQRGRKPKPFIVWHPVFNKINLILNVCPFKFWCGIIHCFHRRLYDMNVLIICAFLWCYFVTLRRVTIHVRIKKIPTWYYFSENSLYLLINKKTDKYPYMYIFIRKCTLNQNLFLNYSRIPSRTDGPYRGIESTSVT